MEISTHATSTNDLFSADSRDDLLYALALRARTLCDTENASIILVDRHRGDLYFRMTADDGELLSTVRIPMTEASLAGSCVLKRIPIVVADVSRDPHSFTDVDRRTRSIMAVPLLVRGEPLGVVEAINKRGEVSFAAQDVAALSTLAEMAAATLHHLNEKEALRNFFTFAIELQADLADAQAGRRGRCMRLAHLSRAIGRKLGMNSDQLQTLWLASYCHDLGRLLMTVEGRTYDSIAAASAGAESLAGVETLAEVADMVRMIHERFDGSGLPAHLRGEQIPLPAQVLAMAVDFENVRDSVEGLDGTAIVAYFINRSGGRHAPDLLGALHQIASTQSTATTRLF